MSSPFDFSRQLGVFGSAGKWGRVGWRLGRQFKASQVRRQIDAEYDAETAEAVAAANASGRNPKPILEWAERRKAEAAERDQLLANPPPLHGSAAWASGRDLGRLLKGRDHFDCPSSILLGTFVEEVSRDPAGFVHWDGDGHLLTLAPTRAGKSVTTIIPNLLRYRGSAVVLYPKGELYEATSAWRAANVGPVYRIAPSDTGADPKTREYPRHGFNPLARIRSQHQARSLAQLMFPRDPNGQEFFNDDAVGFLTGIILYILDSAPEHRCNLGTVREATAAPLKRFMHLIGLMSASRLQSVREAADNMIGKSKDRGLPNLRDTLHSKLSLWRDPSLLAVTGRNDVDFASLKDRPATVYITVPFNLLEPHAPFVKVLLKAALDAMLDNQAKPDIPVLFVLDEFLSLGPFPEFGNAIRTHASAGVRLWFFLLDMGTLEEHYPGTAWHAFLNASVKQFFGVDDPFTAELVGRYLGNQTVAYRNVQTGGNVSAQMGSWLENGSAGVSLSSGESIQFLGRPLLTPDEVIALLSDWHSSGTRTGVVHVRGPRAFKVQLEPFNFSYVRRARIGAYRVAGGVMSKERMRLDASRLKRGGGIGQKLLLILGAEVGLLTTIRFTGGLAAPLMAGILAVPLFGLTMGYVGLSRSRDRIIRDTRTELLAENHPITRMVHMLARELNLAGMPKVGIYPDRDMNAFAAGSGHRKAVVSFSRGLIDGCTNRELMAIAAHEVAHIANNDMRRMQYAWWLQNALTWYMMVERARVVVRWLVSTIGELLILRLSPKREFWADAIAAALLGPEPMIEALRRLDADAVEPPASKLAYARMMIRAHPRAWLSTHPSIEDRIEALAQGMFTQRLPYRRLEM